MPTNNLFNFDNSYLSLPAMFYSIVKPASFPHAALLLLNEKLCDELNVATKNPDEFIDVLFCDKSTIPAPSFAQAYAGHQFGHFTTLGDGRAIIIGEHITKSSNRYDIQLKGSGRTPYSRSGDGKATVRSMLREYLISEAMHHLKIPSSRSLAVIKTGEPVVRETMHEGSALVRVMKSHIRVGTFEYAAHFGSTSDVKALTAYTIQRLYPEIEHDENPVLSLLNKVMVQQIELVVNWMRVGFIHGVMNTDNTSVSGESFDYGPCAFINTYHPDTVFSSIDHYGRYAFNNQPHIIKWNISKLAEALLPLLHENSKVSLELAQTAIDTFDTMWHENYYATMLKKIGIERNTPDLYPLVEELLHLMKELKMDYTNTFLALSRDLRFDDGPFSMTAFKPWLEKWNEVIDSSNGMERAQQVMNTHNPIYIPRNQIVEQALDEAANGNLHLFERLLGVLSQPYHYQNNSDEFMKPSSPDFEMKYQTFCGT